MKKLRLFSVVLVLVLLWAVPVFAQAGESPSSEPAVTLTLGQIFVGIIAAVAAGGITGIAGVGVLAQRLKSDAPTMKAIERLGDSVPPETAKQVIEVVAGFQQSLNSIFALVKEALDRIPADSKPPNTA